MARPAWTLLRAWTALLCLVLGALARLAPSRFRQRALRTLGRDLGKLEQILRSLLVLMRVPAVSPQPLPFAPRSGSDALRRPRRRPHFFLTLRKFSWAPIVLQPAASAHGTIRHAATERLDPASALKRRVDALRAVLAAPAPHAARMTALLAAHGLRLSAPKPLIPHGLVWTPSHLAAPVCAPMHAPAHPDTS
jgi:hypothetical protein